MIPSRKLDVKDGIIVSEETNRQIDNLNGSDDGDIVFEKGTRPCAPRE